MDNFDPTKKLEAAMEERRQELNSVTDFAPRRKRSDRQETGSEVIQGVPHAPVSTVTSDEAFARNALTVYEGVKQLQDKERVAREELNAANARIEQFRIAGDQLALDLNNLRVELDRERAERIRLATIIENIGGLVADGLANVRVDGSD